MRYLRQRSKADCGVTTVLNLMKWAGLKVDERKYALKVKKKINYVSHGVAQGVSIHDMERYLIKYADGTEWVSRHDGKVHFWKRVKRLNDTLEKNGVAIICHYFMSNHGHYELCIGRNQEGYVVVNHVGKTVQTIHRKVMYIMLRKRGSFLGYEALPVMWLLRKS